MEGDDCGSNLSISAGKPRVSDTEPDEKFLIAPVYFPQGTDASGVVMGEGGRIIRGKLE